MKRFRLIALLLWVGVAACTPRNDVASSVETRQGTSLPTEASPALANIDSLMWRQPDSALTVLMDYFASRDSLSATAFDDHYAQLLAAELLYKNDYQQTNRTDLLQAVAYFDSLVREAPPFKGAGGIQRTSDPNLFFLAARAHYINGVGYYEQDSVVPACQQYLKALEIMEGHFAEKELVGKKAQFMALTFTHLTAVFSDLYLHEQALYFGRRSLAYFQKYEASPQHVAWMLDEIGSHYQMMKHSDSAGYYYQAALEILPNTNSQTYRDIASHQAILLYETSHHPEKALAILRHLATIAVDDNERSGRYLPIGSIYYSEQQFDSAQFYYEYVYQHTLNPDGRMLSACRLQEIFMAKGDSLKAYEYASASPPFITVKDKEGELHSNVTTLYQQYEQDRQEALHQQKTQKMMKWGKLVLMAVAFLALILLCSHIVHRKRQHHLKEQQKETEERLEATMQDHRKALEEKDLALNKALLEEREKAQNALKARERQHSATLGKVKHKMEHLQEENRLLNERNKQTGNNIQQPKAGKEAYEALTREGICVNIRQRLKKAEAYTSFDVKDYASLSLSTKELSELVQVIDRHCPGFSITLKKLYPKLSSNDMQLCRLYLLDLSVLQVAILLGTDYSSIRKRTNRLKEKTGSKEIFQQLKSTFFEAD